MKYSILPPLHVLKELLYVWQTVKTLIRRCVVRRLIWIYVVCIAYLSRYDIDCSKVGIRWDKKKKKKNKSKPENGKFLGSDHLIFMGEAGGGDFF